MNQNLRCDWLPERTRFFPARLPAVSGKKIVFFFQIINPLLIKLIKMATYWAAISHYTITMEKPWVQSGKPIDGS